MVRKSQRVLNSALRSMEKERFHMEQQEKRLIVDIKKLAKEGQLEAVRITAKDIVRTRQYIKKFMLMKANIQAVTMQVVSVRSQYAVADAMKRVTIAMRAMNRQINLPQIQKIIQEFEKQSAVCEMKSDIISESVDETFGDDTEADEESDNIVCELLDELGLQLKDQLCDLPDTKGHFSKLNGKSPAIVMANKGGPASSQGGGPKSNFNDDDFEDLQTRLNNLRKG